MQGWEFAHRFSERIGRFLPKNERMSDSLKKRAIRSFLVSDLSDERMSEFPALVFAHANISAKYKLHEKCPFKEQSLFENELNKAKLNVL